MAQTVVPGHGAQGPGPGTVEAAARWRRRLASPVGATLAAGFAAGLVWRVLAVVAADASDLGERQVAADGSFFVLTATLGVLTAIALWRRPGRVPALRLATVLVSATAASALAVAVSWAVGGPLLAAWGGLVVWPWVCAMLVAGVATVRLVLPPRE